MTDPGAGARPLSAAKAKKEARRAAAGRRDGARGELEGVLEPGMHLGEFVDGLVAASRLELDAYERVLRRTACELANGGTVEFADGFFAAGGVWSGMLLPYSCPFGVSMFGKMIRGGNNECTPSLCVENHFAEVN